MNRIILIALGLTLAACGGGGGGGGNDDDSTNGICVSDVPDLASGAWQVTEFDAIGYTTCSGGWSGTESEFTNSMALPLQSIQFVQDGDTITPSLGQMPIGPLWEDGSPFDGWDEINGSISSNGNFALHAGFNMTSLV